MGRRIVRCLLRRSGARKAQVVGVLVTSVIVVASVGGCAASSASPSALPDTPAGSQARWLFGAVAKAPLSSSEIEAHFDSALLAKVSPAHLNSTFVAFESLAVDSVTSSTASTIDVVVTVHAGAQLSVDLSVNTRGLISSLQFLPVGATPSSVAPEVPSTWAGVEADFNFIAPDVRFVVASASNGSCRAIASSGADTATPLASSFKLVVLDALAKAIEARRVSWNEQLTVTSALRSVKSSVLQAEPDGTRISVQDAASDMISISDNTAAGSTCPTPGGDSAARR